MHFVILVLYFNFEFLFRTHVVFSFCILVSHSTLNFNFILLHSSENMSDTDDVFVC